MVGGLCRDHLSLLEQGTPPFGRSWNPSDLLMAIPIMSLVKPISLPSDLPDDTNPQNSSDPLDGSEPRPLITRTEVNHALEALQLYVIQIAPSTAALPEISAFD